jgi:TolB protein
MKRILQQILLLLLLAVLNINANVHAQGDDVVSDLTGKIAYIGADYNVYSLSLQDGQQVKLTEDASLLTNPIRYYRWPTWATDGRLAYFLVEGRVDERGVTTSEQLNAFVSVDGTGLGKQVYSGINELFQYAYWSPKNCGEGLHCRDLALLLGGDNEGENNLYVELIRDTTEGASNQSIWNGTPPLYYSWSPDGTRLFWQQSRGSLGIYDVTKENIVSTLPQVAGAFQAPAWSPIDDRLLFGAQSVDRAATDLTIFSNGQSQTIAAGLRGNVAFAWSPDGTSIAYTNQQGPLVIVDATSGAIIARTDISGVSAFFWSPNSQHIAYITLATPPASFASELGSSTIQSYVQLENTPTISWSVLTPATGNVHHYGSFLPTAEMRYLLLYFDQFAQSHRIWSPDSTHLIYSHIISNNNPIISILDTSQPDSVPFAIANGYIGVWSFE